MSGLIATILSLLAIFLVLLVLVQRGRGGGLAGALGGMGGSSAFGAKAGDIFTRITIITASIWIVFCLIALFWSKHHGDVLGKSNTPSAPASLPMTPPAGSTVPPAGAPGASNRRHGPAGQRCGAASRFDYAAREPNIAPGWLSGSCVPTQRNAAGR